MATQPKSSRADNALDLKYQELREALEQARKEYSHDKRGSQVEQLQAVRLFLGFFCIPSALVAPIVDLENEVLRREDNQKMLVSVEEDCLAKAQAAITIGIRNGRLAKEVARDVARQTKRGWTADRLMNQRKNLNPQKNLTHRKSLRLKKAMDDSVAYADNVFADLSDKQKIVTLIRMINAFS